MSQKIVTLTQKDKKFVKSNIIRKVGVVKRFKDELKKVTWTSKKDLIAYTKVVVISTFVFGIGIYVIDIVVRDILNLINLLMHKII